MRVNKKFLYLLVGILTLIAVAVFIYIFPSILLQRQIEVVDKSQVYDIKYNHSAVFNKYLADWGIWKQKNFSLNGRIYYTIKKIRIILIDEDEGIYKLSNDKSEISSSATASVVSNGVLEVGLYLNPLLAKKYDVDRLNRTAFFPLLKQLFNPVHRGKLSDKGKTDAVVGLMSKFDSPRDLPYELSVQSK